MSNRGFALWEPYLEAAEQIEDLSLRGKPIPPDVATTNKEGYGLMHRTLLRISTAAAGSVGCPTAIDQAKEDIARFRFRPIRRKRTE